MSLDNIQRFFALRILNLQFAKHLHDVTKWYPPPENDTVPCMGSREGGGGEDLFVGCLTSQQHASVSQEQICSENCTCYHTEIKVVDQTFHLTQSQYTDTRPTRPSTDPIMPGAWQGSQPTECQFLSHWYDSTPKKSRRKRDLNPGSSALEADALTTRPTRQSEGGRGGGGWWGGAIM